MLDLFVGLPCLTNLHFDVILRNPLRLCHGMNIFLSLYYNNINKGNHHRVVFHWCCANVLPFANGRFLLYMILLLIGATCPCVKHINKYSDFSSYNVISMVFCCISVRKKNKTSMFTP